MIGPLVRLTLWLLAGHAVLAALFWGLLNVPESNLAMLGLSAVAALLLVLGEAALLAGAVGLARRERGWLPAGGTLLRALPRALAALVVYAVVRYAFVWLSAWYASRTSEIDAWLIATGDWTRTAALHTVIDWSLWGLGHVLAAAVALAILLALSAAPAAAAGWRRVFAPVPLLTIAAILLVGVWLPWQAVGWRPDALPDTVVQPMFAGTKLLLLLTIAHASVAFLLLRLTRSPSVLGPRSSVVGPPSCGSVRAVPPGGAD